MDGSVAGAPCPVEEDGRDQPGKADAGSVADRLLAEVTPKMTSRREEIP